MCVCVWVCVCVCVCVCVVYNALSHSGLNLTIAYDSMELSTVITISVTSLMVLTVISILVICGIKLRNKTSSDIEASDPHTKVGKKHDRKEDVPVVHNNAYAMHNVSRCIQVYTHPNEAYSVCAETKINDEPVYEQVQ